jgi:trehalose/maltose transport system substrate-binding protein
MVKISLTVVAKPCQTSMGGFVMKTRYALSALAVALTVGAFGLVGAQSGVTVTIACGAVGQELDLCREATAEWAKKTGNKVVVLETPQLTNDRLGFYQQNLAAGSSDIDVYQIDVIHPGILGGFMVDLKANGVTDADLKAQNQGIVANNTYQGKLVAMPWFTDGGVLYYRSDLLRKYNVAVPKTWTQLFAAAKKVQDGERKTNNNFYGFVFQGNAYEGLTCDAVEWIASHGGGSVIDAKGNVTINNPKAILAIDTIAKNIKNISPPGVTTYDEEAARGVFQSGNAAFMRNWPYAYSLGQQDGSAVKGKIGIAALPAAAGASSAAALGGWQLSVSKFSKNPKAATDLVRYLTSSEVQKARAIKGSFQPTIPALYNDKDVIAANPFFKDLAARKPIARPSTVTGAKYNEVSSAFWTAVHNVLTGKTNATTSFADLEKKLNQIKGSGW